MWNCVMIKNKEVQGGQPLGGIRGEELMIFLI
jgi:hypothetical protein